VTSDKENVIMGILSTMPFFNHGDFECLPPLMTYMYTVQRKTETMINVLVIWYCQIANTFRCIQG